jgi:hypothetical protein
LLVEVILPIVVKTDYFGAIFMSENASIGVQTRHVDTRYHYVQEFIKDGFIKIKIFRLMENDSDMSTKNFGPNIYEKHTAKFFGNTSVEDTECTFENIA